MARLAERPAPTLFLLPLRGLATALLCTVLAGAAAAQLRGPPGRPQQEEARLRTAISLNPGAAAYHADLAELLMAQGRLTDAAQSYREAHRLDSDDPEYAAALGEVLLQLQQWEAAAAAFQDALELDSTRVAYLVGLARAQEALGEVVEARRSLRLALALDPADTVVQRLWRESGTNPVRSEREAASLLAGVLQLVRWAAAVVLSVAGIGLALPILGALFLLLVRAPLALLQRAGTAAP